MDRKFLRSSASWVKSAGREDHRLAGLDSDHAVIVLGLDSDHLALVVAGSLSARDDWS